MYVIRWVGRVGRVGRGSDYLAGLDGDIDITAKWHVLKSAKKFETKKEAEGYLINPENGHRYWPKDLAQVIFMHPLNAE